MASVDKVCCEVSELSIFISENIFETSEPSKKVASSAKFCVKQCSYWLNHCVNIAANHILTVITNGSTVKCHTSKYIIT
jgi:hypothetical protein